MKRFLSGFLAGIFVFGLFGLSEAETLVKDVTAQVSYKIKMKLNGGDFNPTDTDGSAIRPIVYNGRSYLPVRALCDALKTKVDWDTSTQTMWIGERGETISIDGKILTPEAMSDHMYYTENSDMLYLGGQLFNRGVKSKEQAYDYYVSFENIKGKAKKIGGYIYLEEGKQGQSYPFKGSKYNVTFRKSKDENKEVLAKYEVEVGKPFKFELDTNGANIAVMEIVSSDNNVTNNAVSNFSLLDLYYKN